jgi:hypothetical protein
MFVATPEDIKRICSQTIHFGEINGKHSECSIDFEESDFEIIPSTPEILEWFLEHAGGTGYDPRSYMYCPECGAHWGGGEFSDDCEKCTQRSEEESEDA